MYKLSPIYSVSNQKPGAAYEVYIAQPDATKEEIAGKLFIVAEIESKKADALKIINFLIEAINSNYYQSEKIILRERIRTLRIDQIFEGALAQTNQDLAEFLEAEKIKISPLAFNITIGLIYDNEIHFSSIGKNRAFLIFKKKNDRPVTNLRARNRLRTDAARQAESGYSLVDLAKKNLAKSPLPDMDKLFSDITSGPLMEDASFLFSNEALPEYLSSRQLVEIITKLPPTSAAEQIKNTLATINSYVSFIGIIIKNSALFKVAEANSNFDRREKVAVNASVDGLQKTENKTEKLLSPSGSIDFGRWLKLPSGILSKVKNPADKNFFLKDKVFVKKKNWFLLIKKYAVSFKNIILSIISLITIVVQKLIDKQFWLNVWQKIKTTYSKTKSSGKNFITWYQALTKRNKIIFSAALVCFLILATSLTYTFIKNQQTQKQLALSALKQTIEQKQNQVEADLLYGNEDHAKTLLTEIQSMLDQLKNDKNEADAYQNLSQKNNEQLSRVRHVELVDNPQSVADFSKLNAQALPNNITLSNDELYAADPNQKAIYALNLKSNLITTVNNNGFNIQTLDLPALTSSGNIYYLNGSNLLELNVKNNTLSSLSVTLPTGRQSITAAAGYSSKIYLLDNQNNQIYRYRKSTDGFTSYDNWLSGNRDLSQAVSMSIDGNVYVLNKDGSIIKFYSGQTEGFTLDTINPAFTKVDKIYVSPEENGNIYIFEATANRLAVFDKSGKFIQQYQVNNINNLKDFAINEKSQKIYFLAGSGIYETDLK